MTIAESAYFAAKAQEADKRAAAIECPFERAKIREMALEYRVFAAAALDPWDDIVLSPAKPARD